MTDMLIPGSTRRRVLSAITLASIAALAGGLWPIKTQAEQPLSSYAFPAGGQRGTKCRVRIGGLFTHDGSPFEMFGPQIDLKSKLRATETIWFDNPIVNPPVGEGGDERPRDYLVDVDIPAAAEVGPRHWRLWTSQGATSSKTFVVGDLPEIVEEEIPGRPVPTDVKPPLTINGRIFPSEDVDVWRFPAKIGETWLLSISAAEFGSPLRARMQLFAPDGMRLEIAHGTPDRDPQLLFTATQEGIHEVRIDDVRLAHTVANGGFQRPAPQSFVYRLTVAKQRHVSGYYPLGGRRGTTIPLELLGEDIPTALHSVTLPQAPEENWNTRFNVAGLPTNPVTLELSDLEEVLEREPNDHLRRAQPAVSPTVINGRIGRAGDEDLFRLPLRKGQAYDFDLRATRLASPLDAVLVISDSRDRELARDESLSDGQNDPSLRFTAPADGEYLVRISGRLTSRGGPAHAYRLYVTPAAADFQLALLRDAVTVPRDGSHEPLPPTPRRKSRRNRDGIVSARLPVRLDAVGPLGVPIRLAVEGLPPGIEVTGTEIPAGSNGTDLVFSTDLPTPILSARITVRGTAEIDGKKVNRTAELHPRWNEPAIEQVRLAVALPTPFKLRGATDYSQSPRGTIFRWQYLIDRMGYDGPINVQLSDRQPRQLQGMSGPVVEVPAGINFCTYPAILAPWMAAGRASRSAVMGSATVADRDGSRHVVFYSAEDARSQIYMLVTASSYSLDLSEQTIAARPGGTADIRVRVVRGPSFHSPVRIKLQVPPHLRGVSADPIVVSPQSAEGTMRLRFSEPLGPLNMPVTLRAMSLDTPDPLEAETQLELVDAR